VVKDVLDPNRDIAALMAEYEDVLDGIAASLLAKGAVGSTYRDWWFPAVAPTTLVSGVNNFPA
jgi:hypothetical protein